MSKRQPAAPQAPHPHSGTPSHGEPSEATPLLAPPPYEFAPQHAQQQPFVTQFPQFPHDPQQQPLASPPQPQWGVPRTLQLPFFVPVPPLAVDADEAPTLLVARPRRRPCFACFGMSLGRFCCLILGIWLAVVLIGETTGVWLVGGGGSMLPGDDTTPGSGSGDARFEVDRINISINGEADVLRSLDVSFKQPGQRSGISGRSSTHLTVRKSANQLGLLSIAVMYSRDAKPGNVVTHVSSESGSSVVEITSPPVPNGERLVLVADLALPEGAIDGMDFKAFIATGWIIATSDFASHRFGKHSMRVDVGDIRIDDLVANQAEVCAGIGDIGVKALQADSAILGTKTGDIKVVASVSTLLKATCNDGDIKVTASALDNSEPEIDLQTSTGDIEGMASGFKSLRSSSETGDIGLELAPAQGANISALNSVGDISLRVSSFRGHYTALTTIGDIDVKAKGVSIDKRTGRVGEEAPNPSSLSARTNTGDVSIKFTS
ncbi:hypothetical protein HK105_200385 [Polyrhizophydium stewartii]|uniref:DUF4097 domain-containing protein n=1 Tax=Polyrhizophydium stewartii TaxID=2732419 RepID=A0ABR4NLB5_9FUNG